MANDVIESLSDIMQISFDLHFELMFAVCLHLLRVFISGDCLLKIFDIDQLSLGVHRLG
jgi:hypothetical protein